MKQEKHNGYHNYDTWLVVLWLTNDEYNYHRAKKEKNALLILKGFYLKLHLIQEYNFGDDNIDWNNVYIREIKEVIRGL